MCRKKKCAYKYASHNTHIIQYAYLLHGPALLSTPLTGGEWFLFPKLITTIKTNGGIGALWMGLLYKTELGM